MTNDNTTPATPVPTPAISELNDTPGLKKSKKVPSHVGCDYKEVDAKELPFRKSAVADKIDLDNCTYFVAAQGGNIWNAIMEYGTDVFSQARFRVRGGKDVYEVDARDLKKKKVQAKGSDMESESDNEPEKIPAVDDEVWILDSVNKSEKAVVTEVQGDEIKISYVNWSSKWDEWLQFPNDRIQHIERVADQPDKDAVEHTDHEISTTLELDLGVYESTYREKKIVLLVQQIGGVVATSCSVTRLREMVIFTEGKGKEAKFRLQQFVEMVLRFNTVIKCRPPPRTTFGVYRWDIAFSRWNRVSTEKSRKMRSVILPEGFKDLVEKDMERFLSDEGRKWYSKYSIPYKRSYLFYGLPGTGKTSLITALAGQFERNVCFLAAHHPRFTDETFHTAIRQLPESAIVVLEDIDSLFDKHRNTMNQRSPLTFTGLLNGLDGIGEPTGTIFIMTTNFIDRLDPALIRAGRVDMKVKFNAANDKQLEEFFLWFQEDDPKAKEYAPLFVKEVRKTFPGREVTMAELQGHFIDNYMNDAKTCVENVKNYVLDEGHAKLAFDRVEKGRKEDTAEKRDRDERGGHGGFGRPQPAPARSRDDRECC